MSDLLVSVVVMSSSASPVGADPASLSPGELERTLESHRRELTGFCYRMLGSGSEADDSRASA